jgi:RNA polymerase sigma-32 factor
MVTTVARKQSDPLQPPTRRVVEVDAPPRARPSLEALDGELLDRELADDPVTASIFDVEPPDGAVIELAGDDIPLPLDPISHQLPSTAYALSTISSPLLTGADPLTTYLAQLRNLDPLPAERQQDLAERYHRSGDVEAARSLIMSNLRLVVKIAREYHRRKTSLMELVQEGNVGLAEAIRRYDPYRGVKFTSYAQYWIRAMILNYLMNVMQFMKVGSTRSGRKLFYNLAKAREQLVRQGFLSPTTRQLAEHLGVDEEDVIGVARVLDAPAMSLDAPAPGFEETPLGEIISDSDVQLPDEQVVSADLSERIRKALSEFRTSITDARELAIWDRRVVADEPLSLQEIGEEFNVSRERIRQVEKSLKERFKDYWRDQVGPGETEIILAD